MPNTFAPIWRDIVYTANTDSLNFEIKTDDEQTIYQGRSVRRPDGSNISINLTRIAQDYLFMRFPDLRNSGGIQLDTDAAKTFRLYNSDTDSLIMAASYINDYSYDASVNYSADVLMSHPINGKADLRQYSLYTQFESATSEVKTYYNPENNPYYSFNYCGDAVLYYLNRYGGWDCFLIEGKVVKTDTYDKLKFRKNYVTETLEFGRMQYHNDIITKYALNTGWLTDRQSENLAFNLLSSTQVYLHILDTDNPNLIYPVVITDKSAEYKYYKNGRKLVSYQINVETSQTQQNK